MKVAAIIAAKQMLGLKSIAPQRFNMILKWDGIGGKFSIVP